MTPDEAALAYQRGEPAAADGLYASCADLVGGVAGALRTWCRGALTPDDLEQEAWTQTLVLAREWVPQVDIPFRAYLATMLRYRLRNWVARVQRGGTVPYALSLDPRVVHNPDVETALVLADALLQLPPAIRVLVWLRAVEERPYEEIVPLLGLDLAHARILAWRGRQHLARLLTAPPRPTRRQAS